MHALYCPGLSARTCACCQLRRSAFPTQLSLVNTASCSLPSEGRLLAQQQFSTRSHGLGLARAIHERGLTRALVSTVAR